MAAEPENGNKLELRSWMLMEKQSNTLFWDAGQNICLGVASAEDTGFSSCARAGLVHPE